MHRFFRSLRPAVLVGAALLAACEDGTGPEAGPGVTVIDSPERSDTVGATPGRLLTLEIRDAQNALVRSSPVQLRALVVPAPPLCRVGCSDRGGLVLTDQGAGGGVTRTDDGGRVSFRVRFGTNAGTARLVVSALDGAVVDTLEFTVLPGKAVRVFMVPADSSIYLNTAFDARPSGADRYGNPTADPVTLSSTSLPVSGTRVTGASYGVHILTATMGSMRDEDTVTVVPRGTLAAVDQQQGNRIQVFDLDGSNRRTLYLQGGAQAFGMDWTPDGSALLVAAGTEIPRVLRRVELGGRQTDFFPSEQPTDALRPRYSQDGQWVYFIGRTTGVEPQVLRARPDGTGMEVVPNIRRAEIVAPSHDGSRFAWVSRESFSPLSVYDVATSTSTSLGMRGTAAVWSPVADRLAYTEDRITLGFVDVDGGDPQVVEGQAVVLPAEGPLDWSPDGEWVVYTRWEGLWLRQVSTGLTFPIPSTPVTTPAWK